MNRIIASLRYRINRFFGQLSKPTMVYGYKRADGLFLKNTRISTSTAIISPETLRIEDHVLSDTLISSKQVILSLLVKGFKLRTL
jgi:hypothetical protein